MTEPVTLKASWQEVPKIKLYGIVINENQIDEPIANAKVTFRNNDGSEVYATTDSNGYFEFNVPLEENGTWGTARAENN